MKKLGIILLVLSTTSCQGGSESTTPLGHEAFSFLTSAEGVYQSQVVVEKDGTLLLVWTRKHDERVDLFIAHSQETGGFSEPLQINDSPLNVYTGDEARPSVALGPDGAIGVVWTGMDSEIMAVIGSAHGELFHAPVRLSPDDTGIYRTMPTIDFAADGSLHAVWLDGRIAEPGQEEPADLYYARLEDGTVTEINLTAAQETTVCGCCRPFIDVAESGDIDIVFRNATEAGYRDISRITGNMDGVFHEPRPTSLPVWKLSGCPLSGPILSHDVTLWKDGSAGSWRLLAASDPEAEPDVLLTGTEELSLTYPPRTISTVPGGVEFVLAAAKPASFVFGYADRKWKTLADDLPEWVSSAAIQGDRLIVVGNVDGRFHAEMRAFDWN